MKRSLALFLTFLMLALSFAAPALAEDGKSPDDRVRELYEETVTITNVLGYRASEDARTPEDVTPENSTAVKRFKEELNIDLEYSWVVNSDQFEAKFGAELASGNLPDVMYLTPAQFEDLYEQGGLMDLTEVYELYANDSIKNVVNFDGELLNAGVRDGGLYGLPMATYSGQYTSQTYYRMDYLKQVGIESYDQLPKTIDEFEALCDLLMETDFNADGTVGGPIIPANQRTFNEGLADFSPVFHAYSAFPDGWVDVDGSGELVYMGIQEGIKEPIKKLNEWYEKGYFAKDFAAQDVWGASAPCVDGIIAGDFPIVFGSWWIANWPLNMNKEVQPEADWVVGPTLTANEDGSLPTVVVPRYPVNAYVCVSRDCKNPEAVFKMMNWSIEYTAWKDSIEFERTSTEEEKTEAYSYVYTWLPYRVYAPNTLIANYQFLHENEAAGNVTEETIDLLNAPQNNEFMNVYKNFLLYHDPDEELTGTVWGNYTSRVAENGGVAKMYELYSNVNKYYNEAFSVTTPSMVTRKGELDNFYKTTLLSMVMGETSVDDGFDTFVSQWLGLGGEDIGNEVNEWFKNQ